MTTQDHSGPYRKVQYNIGVDKTIQDQIIRPYKTLQSHAKPHRTRKNFTRTAKRMEIVDPPTNNSLTQGTPSFYLR